MYRKINVKWKAADFLSGQVIQYLTTKSIPSFIKFPLWWPNSMHSPRYQHIRRLMWCTPLTKIWVNRGSGVPNFNNLHVINIKLLSSLPIKQYFGKASNSLYTLLSLILLSVWNECYIDSIVVSGYYKIHIKMYYVHFSNVSARICKIKDLKANLALSWQLFEIRM